LLPVELCVSAGRSVIDHDRVLCKTAELNEMPFEGRVAWALETMY